MTMEQDKGTWLFTDEFGNVWRLTPTGDVSMPLIITLEKRVVG